jgi:uncharacterized protein (TIGR03437 family)
VKISIYAGMGALMLAPVFAAAAPVINNVQNNYSYILPGLPNYGIAPGTLFLISGTDLADDVQPVLQSSAAPGLPLTFNNASVSVTVNGTTTHPAIYYATRTGIAAVLPSSTPVGNGTITVTWKGTASSPAPIQVVASSLGLDTLYGDGTGIGVVTDTSGALLSASTSARPGQTIVLWGSGLGATSDSDTTYTSAPHAVSTPLQVLIGGVQANVVYAGGAGYPGVNQINVVVPAGVQPGCGVSVLAVSGNIVSNTISIPVSAAGGACADPLIDARTPLQTTRTSYKFGSIVLSEFTDQQGRADSACGNFSSLSGIVYSRLNAPLSVGSCFANQAVAGPTTTTSTFTTTGLDAGTLTISGLAGTRTLLEAQGTAGTYIDLFPTGFMPDSGAAYTIIGVGGKDVGAFTAQLNFPAALVWTNRSSIANVKRSDGITFTWTGGAPQTFVTVSGFSSTSSNGTGAAAGFGCNVPVSAGQFTVPASVLLALPAGTGTVSIQNFTLPVPFSATGIDYGYFQGLATGTAAVSFQ